MNFNTVYRVEAKHLNGKVLISGVLEAAAAEHHTIAAELNDDGALIVNGFSGEESDTLGTYVANVTIGGADWGLPVGLLDRSDLEATGILAPENYLEIKSAKVIPLRRK